jgi:hypothetical protein
MDGIKPHCMGTAFPEFRTPALFMTNIKPHCMGTAFPERPISQAAKALATIRFRTALPTAADLDAVAEEQRVKQETDGK